MPFHRYQTTFTPAHRATSLGGSHLCLHEVHPCPQHTCSVNWNYALAGSEFGPCPTILEHCSSATCCLPCQCSPALILVSSLAVVQQRRFRPSCHRLPMAAARAGSNLTATWHQFTGSWREKQWLDLSGITHSVSLAGV